jgi:hypothetical protein
MQSYFQNPPQPFLDGWQHAPVPGWGANPQVAGPARVGVGQTVTPPPGLFRAAMYAMKVPNGGGEATEEPPPYEEDKPFPWLYVVAGTLVLGAGTAFAYNMGWLKF